MSASAVSAAAVAASSEGSLLAVIGDEDLVTGFLLAGVGNLDSRRKSTFSNRQTGHLEKRDGRRV